MSARNKLQELLDSDDELPTSYQELTYVPAYQDDNRFNDIALYNLTKDCYSTSEDSVSDTLSLPESEEEFEKVPTEKRDDNSVLLRGVMSRKDAYCIKVLGTVYDDDTLLWFIKYTIFKSFQSGFSFLVSCLVGDLHDYKGNDIFFNDIDEKRQHVNTKYTFAYN